MRNPRKEVGRKFNELIDYSQIINTPGGGGSGTVTSVAMTVPTGLSISGTPITTSGTLALTLTAGYSIPTTASQTTWDTAYTNRITSLTVTGSSGSATLVSNVLNIPTYTLTGLGGQPLATNLTSLSSLSYVSASFVKMTASGTFTLDTNTYYLASNPSGYTSNTGTVISVAALTLGTTGTDLSSTVATGTTTAVITLNVPTASATNRGALSSTDWSTFNNKQATITLTTTGSSGAATFVTNTLNIPNYTLAGLGGFANPMTTLGDSIYGAASGTPTRLAGNITTVKQYLSQTGTGTVSAAPIWSAIAGADITGAALTKTDDTNVTLTLGGTPTTALLRAASITVGWTGTLADARIASAATWNAKESALTFSSPLSRATNTISIPAATTSVNGYLTSTDWTTFNNKQTTITLTTTGSSGSATFVTNTLNIPTYTLTGLGGQPLATNLTSLAALSFVSTSFVKMTAAGTFALDTTVYTANTGTVTSVAALTLGTTGTDLSSSVATGTTTPVITLNVPTASAANRGALSSADWTTFNNKESALTFNAPLSRTTNTISIPSATTSVSGYLTSTDWNTFNGKFTLPSLTSGSVLFSDGSTIAQDNTNFFWDNSNKRLGIGTTTPANTLDVVRGTAGAMGRGTYESASFSYNGDMKLGLYTSAAAGAGGASLIFGTTNILAGAIYPGFELQFGPSATLASNYMRFNSVGRNSSGAVTSSVADILNIFQAGNITIGTATNSGYKLDVNGTTRIQNKLSVGTPSAASALMEITSTTLGFLTPRMTNAQRTAIATPATGLIAYSTDSTEGMYVKLSGAWQRFLTTADGTGTGTVTSVAALTLGTTGTDLSSSVATGTTTPVITLNVPTASAANRGALSSTDWSTFNGKQSAITLTTTGTSGAATLVGATLNIPQYSGTNIYNTDGTLTSNRIINSGGFTLSINAAVGIAGGATISTYMRILNGDASIYGNGTIDFQNTTAAGDVGIVTQLTGAATMNFEHRATSNTGNFIWRNGTAGATTLLTLSSAGAGTFASSVTATSFVKTSGTSAQILAADGSVITAGTNITIGSGTISVTGLSAPYTLQAWSYAIANFTFTDAQLLYIGAGNSLNVASTEGQARIYVPNTGTITAIYVYANGTTTGSTETWTLDLLKNNSTAVTIQALTGAANAFPRVWSNTALSISVVAGDYLEIRSNSVTWATNPVCNSGTGFNATIFIQ
jgi:hypothetical protein